MFSPQLVRFVTPAALVLLATAFHAVAFEDRRYHVDFSSPPHTVGMPPSPGTTSSPSNGVPTIVFGKPTVVAAFGALTQQPLELRGGGPYTDYSQIQFGVSNNDFVTFEADFCIRTGAGSSDLNFIFDTPEVRTVTFNPNGKITLYVPYLPNAVVGTFEFDRKNTFRAHINLRAATWRLFLNGALLSESNFSASNVETIRINLRAAAAQNPAAAIDNIVINSYWNSPNIIEQPENQVAPESGTAMFRVIASGQSNDPRYRVRFQWLFNGSPIEGATSDRLIIDKVTKDHAGSYSVIVSKEQYTPTTSTAATLTVTPAPARLLNISTRLNVQQGERALIGGFIVVGDSPKRLIVRAIGPSLQSNGVPVAGSLADPTLQLFNSKGEMIAENDNWRDTQEQQIIGTTIPPAHEKEAAIVGQLEPGNYTAIVRGVNNGTGVGLVEVYDVDGRSGTRLANVSTRGQVQTGDNVMIGGLIVGGGETARILVRAIGPSLQSSQMILPDPLVDPFLQLRNADGELMAENDDWKQGTQREQIEATGAQPTDDREAAIIAMLPSGNYTAIVAGMKETTGLAVVEVYQLEQ